MPTFAVCPNRTIETASLVSPTPDVGLPQGASCTNPKGKVGSVSDAALHCALQSAIIAGKRQAYLRTSCVFVNTKVIPNIRCKHVARRTAKVQLKVDERDARDEPRVLLLLAACVTFAPEKRSNRIQQRSMFTIISLCPRQTVVKLPNDLRRA